MPDYTDLAIAPSPLRREITRLPIAARSSLPVYPNGWFRVASSAELSADRLTPLTYFGRHLIGFRAPDGTARVADAYCPHLGAHLASHTGRIEDGTIVCPFHHWRWSAETGRCTAIPYADRAPPKAKIAFHPVREYNGIVAMWHHAEGAPPDHEPYVEERLNRGRWVALDPIRWEMHAQAQEFLENIYDSAHILTLHASPTLPSFVSDEDTAYGLKVVLKIETGFKDYPVSYSYNMFTGVSVAHQNNRAEGRSENVIVSCYTPIDADRVEMVSHFFAEDNGDPGLTQRSLDYMARFKYEVGQDLAILEHKKHHVNPVLCAGDGDIMRWRRYTERFYSAPVDRTRPGAEAGDRAADLAAE